MKPCNCAKRFAVQLALLSALSLLAFVVIWVSGDVRYAIGWLAAALGFALAALGWYEPDEGAARPGTADRADRSRG